MRSWFKLQIKGTENCPVCSYHTALPWVDCTRAYEYAIKGIRVEIGYKTCPACYYLQNLQNWPFAFSRTTSAETSFRGNSLIKSPRRAMISSETARWNGPSLNQISHRRCSSKHSPPYGSFFSFRHGAYRPVTWCLRLPVTSQPVLRKWRLITGRAHTGRVCLHGRLGVQGHQKPGVWAAVWAPELERVLGVSTGGEEDGCDGDEGWLM